MLGSFYTVDEGERGVVIRTGEITGVATPGLHWKLPIGAWGSPENVSVWVQMRKEENTNV